MPINITMTSFSDRLTQRDDYVMPTETRPDPLAQAQSLLQRPTPTESVETPTYSRLEKAKELYPYLKDKDFDYVENLTDDKKAGYLEFWEPGDEGPPDGSVKRPKGIGIDRMGIEVRNPDTRPIDILGDYASHEGIYSDPKLKDIYDRYTSTLTDEQLKVKYEYEKKNYGEDRPFEQWAERSGRPGMFRGYTFGQFSEEEIKEAYTPEQLDILDEAKEYLNVDINRVKTQGVDLSEEPIQSKTIYDNRNVATDNGKAVATPEGIYNNPGNIERSGDKWYGMVEDKGYGKNERFAVFDTPQLGVRAMMKDLRTKINTFDGNLEEIIKKYAPSSENDTNAYIANVKKIIGNKDIVTEKDLKSLAKAVITVENSPKMRDYYLKDPKILDEAYELSKKNL